MSVLQVIIRFLAGHSERQAARDLARQVYAPVRELVEGRLQWMTRSEARGYIRAKAMPLVREVVRDAATASAEVARIPRHELTLAVGERVVQAVLADVGRTAFVPQERRLAA